MAALPNTRLKLAARVVYRTIAFVSLSVWRPQLRCIPLGRRQLVFEIST